MGKYKIGLKLFSSNLGSINMAEKYYTQGYFDYIELMVLPDASLKSLKSWQSLEIPYIVHVPHATYGFNLADPKLRKQNKKIFNQTRRWADELAADLIIVHPGLTGQLEESIRQIAGFKDERLLVENMPFISLRQTRCLGSTIEEIKLIKQRAHVGFCLDVVHTVKAAYANAENYFDYLKRFLILKPRVIHLCDTTLSGCFDEHLNLGEGELGFPSILKMFLKAIPKAYFTLEIPEKSYFRLTNYKMDRLLLRQYLRERT